MGERVEGLRGRKRVMVKGWQKGEGLRVAKGEWLRGGKRRKEIRGGEKGKGAGLRGSKNGKN